MVMQSRSPAVVGLGANLGRPLVTFEQALTLLSRVAHIERVSSVYRTAPVGFLQQPDFYNAAVRLTSSLSPERWMHELLSIERRLGRRRRVRFGPRILDLDLLWIEGVVERRATLTLPHPRLTRRAFALLPMLEVAPEARDPVSGRPYTRWVKSLQGQRIHRLPYQWFAS